jgi:hypothetical protein
MYRMLPCLALLALLPISSRAVQIYDQFPDSIHAGERYVIYSHGLIAEGDDPKPVSPQYGLYDFPAIKEAIFSNGGFNLLAYQRPKSLDDSYNDLADVGINTALLASCEKGEVSGAPDLSLGGNFLSIYEKSDSMGKCNKLAARSHLTSFKEVEISTGRKHGAFFQPLPQWLEPLKAWIAKTNQ